MNLNNLFKYLNNMNSSGINTHLFNLLYNNKS